jgi:hypothetical protein
MLKKLCVIPIFFKGDTDAKKMPKDNGGTRKKMNNIKKTSNNIGKMLKTL